MTNSFEIIHHGAIEGVTGSCHELKISNKDGILVDCGLFQGDDRSPSGADSENLEIEFPVGHIQALLVTHCHIDHVGRIPYLLAAGFKGPIICSEPTAKLLPLVLQDAMQIQVTRNRKLIEKFLGILREQLVAVPYKEWYSVALTDKNSVLRIKFSPAGHVLGSAYIECEVSKGEQQQQILFSGDLGATHTPILVSPRPPYGTDVLVLESTYGNRNHRGRLERRQKLKEVVEHCFADRGAILVPAFSIGRTQELLYEFEYIIHEFRDSTAHSQGTWGEVEVVIDSPLAARFTDKYRSLQDFWDREARRVTSQGRHPLAFEQMTTIESHEEHLDTVKYLLKTARPTIVIAASGMCAGGRIVNYLKSLLADCRTDVLFVGYQAAGTPGRQIQKYGPRKGYVELDDKRYDIQAAVHTLSGYSAHADQKNLLSFVKGMRKKPHQIRLVHGDADAKAGLKKALEDRYPDIEIVV